MTNVKLSEAELALACDAQILLTKNSIINKVYAVFGELATAYVAHITASHIPPEVLLASPKISRGENYLGLPWVMLDYPRYFATDAIFSIRTMFWWGQHFGQYLLVKGRYLPPTLAADMLSQLRHQGWHVCVGSDPWQHHFNDTNMLPLEQFTQETLLQQIERSGFLKLGTKIPIERWESVMIWMVQHFKVLTQLMRMTEK